MVNQMQKLPTLAIIDHVGRKAGMDYFTGNLAQAFAHTGVKVEVYSNFNPGKPGFQSTFTGKRDSLWQKASDFYLGHLKALWLIKQAGIKSVLLHSFETGIKEFSIFFLARLVGLRIGIIVHDVESFAEGDSTFLKKLIFTKLAHILYSLNNFSKEILVEKLGTGIAPKLVLIKHGNFLSQVDASVTRELAFEKLAWDKSFKHILFFGQIKTAKGLQVLIRAFRDLPNTKLVIAGKVWKDDFSIYEELISETDGSVLKYIRFITDEEREWMLKASDLVVIPYLKIFQSGVLLMAMSYGKVVVASDLQANAEIIEDKVNGRLFRSEDSDDLQQVLADALKNEDQRLIMEQNAFVTARDNFSWEAIANTIAKSLLLAQ